MSEYEIEKSIPIPEARRGRRVRYPFGAMAVGESFKVGPEEQRRVQSAASWYGARNGKRFVTRRTPDGGRRVWRLE